MAPVPVATGGCSIFRVFTCTFPYFFLVCFFSFLSSSLHCVWLNLNRLWEATFPVSVQQHKVSCFEKQKYGGIEGVYGLANNSSHGKALRLGLVLTPWGFCVNSFRSRWSYWYEINMPFHQRSIEPQRVSRLSRDGSIPGEETGRRKLRRPVLFSSLDEVGCHTLTNIIHQLSDLSRHASDIFLGIEMEAGMVFRRSCRIQGRLQSLQGEICKFDPKKIKIRKFAATC